MNVSMKTDKHEWNFDMNDRLADKLVDIANIMAVASSRIPDCKEQGVKGFVLTQCEKCGAIRGFCVRSPITYTRCKNCGAKSQIRDTKPATIYCTCGKTFRYSTNIKGETANYFCIACNANALLKLTDDGTEYISGTPPLVRGGVHTRQEGEVEDEG